MNLKIRSKRARYYGGVISFSTKSGSNDFHGSACACVPMKKFGTALTTFGVP